MSNLPSIKFIAATTAVLMGAVVFAMFFILSGFYIGRVFSAIECREYGETQIAGLQVRCEVPSKRPEKDAVFV